ncbi:Acetyltransferase (GNAT) family protein [Paenibacillus algorifonticola]|uniref:Acetyltransferase (GNAT) family protein n=1 Tax=Paenibacillus algorifonticola TaxID=684063 RepID=A0A1I1Z2X3_9BACL|nr:GNAT family N-acetyltransferase [Paenibacillus algorifonticola]SFE26081.1 Acetyltransferase (GNAT) family protein [Paenibacillus algorifonticola]
MENTYVTEQAGIEQLDETSTLFHLYRMFYGQAPDVQGARRFLFERFEQRDSVIFLAKHSESGEAAGFTQLYPVYSSISMKRSYILNDLYVLESHRKQGVAQLLLDQAKSYASLLQAKGIELSTAVTNVQAQRLYERNGYLQDAEYAHYYLML